MQKLFFDPPTRYSEDIDLVQVRQEPIGDAIDAIRKLLDPWLGEPRRERKKSRVTLFLNKLHIKKPAGCGRGGRVGQRNRKG